jgi:hypothetical protein
MPYTCMSSVAGLPPYMGMLASLGFLWAFVDALHFGEERRALSVAQALKRIDTEVWRCQLKRLKAWRQCSGACGQGILVC